MFFDVTFLRKITHFSLTIIITDKKYYSFKSYNCREELRFKDTSQMSTYLIAQRLFMSLFPDGVQLYNYMFAPLSLLKKPKYKYNKTYISCVLYYLQMQYT